ncbi:glucose-1-phosphate thymidylyltransferase [Nitrosopumilus maritimus]|uniref:Glucose-1-phosphate thymidyltransferase n=1 Tax=Nitrosopumilus maritimus (strain SCM1) TaxID=436308 RepID=A9A1Q3_NITMS|nr:glucose-1-phosphate thymidylyltransferase [Nitrosopumilus maritimus]ABX12024.1 glucose-1-phosphate thymidyltransferase [Nitrosopumilus maritimus SCM1]
MKGIILHGGHGTRLRPLTHTGPKQLLPIANKPMSQYCIESMKNAGITEIAIIIGGIASKKVEEYYGNGEKFGVKITYISQEAPKGIAHAINLCKDFVKDDKFLVFLGDNILKKEILEYKTNYENSDADALLLLCEVDNPTQFGIADVKDNKIIKIMEKPKDPPTNLAVTGIYFLNKKIFEIIDILKPSWRNELEITDALQLLMEKGNKIIFDTVTDYWKDTGTPNDILHANKEILQDISQEFLGEKEQTQIDGVCVLKEKSLLKNVKIIGPVLIGKNCIINNNSVIGPNVSIGDNCKISKSKIENSIIMNNCEINSNIKISDSIIAFDCQIFQEKNEKNVLLLGEGTKIWI